MPENIIGQRLLDQFRVDAFVASGGMGAVYRVWDLKRNVPLAMKVLHSELADDPHIFKRFRREANALKKLTHPNIVQFYGLFQTLDLAFLLERYIDGPSLKDVLRQQAGKPLSIQDALVYLKALTSALGYAHINGVVHCDVKPGNVLIDQGGNIYLTDFGIARHAESTTTTMGTAGTAAYMAPEQIRGKSVTPATDVYALGVVLFEMLTGQCPFRGSEAGTEKGGDTANERIRYAHLHVQAPDPRSLNQNISPAVVEVILQSLSKKAEDRFSVVQKFFIALCNAAETNAEKIPGRALVEQLYSQDRGPAPVISDLLVAPATRKKFLDRKFFLLFGGSVLIMLVVGAIIRGGAFGTSPEPSLSGSPPSLFSSTRTAESFEYTATATENIVVQTPSMESTDTPKTDSITSPIDGAVLIRIPAGEFLRGFSEEQVNELLTMCSGCARDAVSDALPQRQIHLDEFWMDQTEVTNAQFELFIANTGYITSAEQGTYQLSYVYVPEINNYRYDGNANWQQPHGSSSNVSGLDTTPVRQVSWVDANTYCQWTGRRLPTEAEWEKAARGTDGRLFVWGDELPNSKLLNFNLAFGKPLPAGSFEAGVSPYGLFDMAGNLWEWVADYYSENYYQSAPDRNPTGPPTGEVHSMHGGSWASEYDNELYYVTPPWRFYNKPHFSSEVLGFRCATSSP